ncbi:MAG: ATP synthase F1 subunit delta [Bacteroidetes bacterium]|nr:ATP synthase F1 subunit delta [Bacteroidota bacterium]
MKSTKSAGRYAKALLELAQDQNKLEVVESNVNSILRASKESNDFQVFLNSPLIKVDKKIEVLNQLFSDFDALTLNFIALTTNNGRERLITEIANSFITQLKELRGIVPVSITSATPLDSKTREVIMSKISASVKGKLEVEELVDKDLIGGFIVRMEDKQIDASVASQLNRMKQELTK